MEGGGCKKGKGAYEKHCTKLRHEVKPCFHCTPIENNTPGKLFNISIVIKQRVAVGKGVGGEVSRPHIFLPSSLCSEHREGRKYGLKLISSLKKCLVTLPSLFLTRLPLIHTQYTHTCMCVHMHTHNCSENLFTQPTYCYRISAQTASPRFMRSELLGPQPLGPVFL